MKLELTPDEIAFRDEVRAFIDARLPDEIRERVRGDHYVVNSQTIWTTTAHVADWMFCLVRSEQDAVIDDGRNAPTLGPAHARGVVEEPLHGRAATNYGGSNEIQRNIVAKMVLGV